MFRARNNRSDLDLFFHVIRRGLEQHQKVRLHPARPGGPEDRQRSVTVPTQGKRTDGFVAKRRLSGCLISTLKCLLESFFCPPAPAPEGLFPRRRSAHPPSSPGAHSHHRSRDRLSAPAQGSAPAVRSRHAESAAPRPARAPPEGSCRSWTAWRGKRRGTALQRAAFAGKDPSSTALATIRARSK